MTTLKLAVEVGVPCFFFRRLGIFTLIFSSKEVMILLGYRDLFGMFIVVLLDSAKLAL
jgi:hypothetical protein